MSNNRDYTRYSKEPVESKKPVEVIETEEPMTTVEPNENVTEDIQTVEVEQEPKIEEPKVEEPKYITGIVTDCVKLNVREDPHPTATILGAITAATELIVDKEASTNDFYKICTPAGLEGYCMKKFVTIMP